MTLVPDIIVEDPRVLFTQVLADHLPKEERYNLYFTAAKSVGAREPVERELLHFDVDNILDAAPEKIFEVAATAIGVDPKKTAAVMSGHGVQFFVLIPEPITNPKYIDERRETYAIMCEAIDMALKSAGLKGSADPKVWDAKRVMRLPWTENIKANKPTAHAWVIQGTLIAQANPIEAWHKQAEEERVPLAQFRKYPPPETEAVLKGCEFLKYCDENAATLAEEHWFREVGITAHLPNGTEITHERSSRHPSYTRRETQAKIDRALKVGPMTCKGMQAHWQKCGTCKYFRDNLATPLLIHSEDYISTKDTGFHDVAYSEKGKPKYSPNYDDLLKYYVKIHRPMVVNNKIYHWDGKYYQGQPSNVAEVFAESNFKPSVLSYVRAEFSRKVMASEALIGDLKTLEKIKEYKTNFQNGVLDLKTMKLEPHNPRYFFRHILPYDYDPSAKAPRFEQFLDEVTQGDQESILTLKEWGGYCLSGDDYWEQKALVLAGTGRNGKSKYGDLLGKLAGEGHSSCVSLSKLGEPTHAVSMDGMLFNLCEEAAQTSLYQSSFFKAATGGGILRANHKFVDVYEFRNKAKIVINCNEIPASPDKTEALLRRLLIVGFNRTFTEEDDDKELMHKLEVELPGIFNAMIDAYIKAKKRGRITVPAKSRESVKAFQLENDNVLEFMHDELVVLPTYGNKEKVKRSELYTKYKLFHDQNGEGKVLGRSRFFSHLKNHIKDLDKRVGKSREGGYVGEFIFGIEFKREEEF
jgi:putative DNA primase/helicase